MIVSTSTCDEGLFVTHPQVRCCLCKGAEHDRPITTLCARRAPIAAARQGLIGGLKCPYRSVRGHRGRTSTHSASSLGAACAGRCSHRPSRMRSMPAQATITPLSVHSFGGGTASSRPFCSANACAGNDLCAGRALPTYAACVHRLKVLHSFICHEAMR